MRVAYQKTSFCRVIASQLINQSINQSINRFNQSISQSINQSINRFIHLTPNKSLNMTVHSTEHSHTKAEKKSLRQSIKHAISTLDESSINQSSDRAIQSFFNIVSLDTAHENTINNQSIKVEIACVYLSMKNEFQTMKLIDQLFKRGVRVFVPRIVRNPPHSHSHNKTDMLMVEAYSVEDINAFPVDSWGIPEPSLTQSTGQPRAALPVSHSINQSLPEIHTNNNQTLPASQSNDQSDEQFRFSSQSPLLILMPGVAFTSSGHRIGHGKGYYDRFLATIKQQHNHSAGNSSHRSIVTVALALNEQIVDHVPTSDHDELVDCVITQDQQWCVHAHPIFPQHHFTR